MTGSRSDWRHDLALGRYADVFASEDIGFDLLADLNESDVAAVVEGGLTPRVALHARVVRAAASRRSKVLAEVRHEAARAGLAPLAATAGALILRKSEKRVMRA